MQPLVDTFDYHRATDDYKPKLSHAGHADCRFEVHVVLNMVTLLIMEE